MSAPARSFIPASAVWGFTFSSMRFPPRQPRWTRLIYKRWRELNPSFVRMTHRYEWDQTMLDQMAAHLLRMKETGAEAYITTWDPPKTQNDAERRAFARRIADHSEYLIRDKGLTNIHYYCMTNELTLGEWGSLVKDLPLFKAYHQALYDEFKARKIPVGLVATDASPQSYWWTNEWAAQNMDDITAIYCGHHYVDGHELGDVKFYSWFQNELSKVVAVARGKGKSFILGEFGSKQEGRVIDGVKRDTCVYWDTPQEPLVTLQLAEMTLASLNSGVYALGYWTFMDFPDDYSRVYINKWGTFKCSGADRSTRTIYYGYGLLTRYFRGPSTVFRVETNDPLLRAAAVRHHDRDTWSIAVINRTGRDAAISLSLEGLPLTAAFRKYEYHPARVPQHPFGDLQDPVGELEMRQGVLKDGIAAGSLVVYTTAWERSTPASVREAAVARSKDGRALLTWRPGDGANPCYYRVYRSDAADFRPAVATQIGSTVATRFEDAPNPPATPPRYYKVVAVDSSGNASQPSAMQRSEQE